MIIARVYRGIHDHFPARRSEWVLAGVMVAWGCLLIGPDDVFTQPKAWAEMAAIASESVWGWLAIAIGTFRFAALIINGTFASTWYGRFSPHVRSVASFLAGLLWLQIAYGLYSTGTVTTGLAVYPGLLLLDVLNVFAASKDAANMDKARIDGRA